MWQTQCDSDVIPPVIWYIDLPPQYQNTGDLVPGGTISPGVALFTTFGKIENVQCWNKVVANEISCKREDSKHWNEKVAT